VGTVVLRMGQPAACNAAICPPATGGVCRMRAFVPLRLSTAQVMAIWAFG
jgi:hypothetical protein